MRLKEISISVKSGSTLHLKDISKAGVRWTTDSPNLIVITGSSLTPAGIGAWVSGKEYKPHDLVKHDGILYECSKGGVSGEIMPDWNGICAGANQQDDIDSIDGFRTVIPGYGQAVEVDGVAYRCIKDHRSSTKTKPGSSKELKSYWRQIDNTHIWRDSWYSDRLYHENSCIEDGKTVQWVRRFSTAFVYVYDKYDRHILSLHLTVVSWDVNTTCFSLLCSSSIYANITGIRRGPNNRFSKPIPGKLIQKAYNKISKLVLRENLKLLAIDNTGTDSSFFVTGRSKRYGNCLYRIRGSIMGSCKLIYRFGSAIQEFLVTPFGYFVALAPRKGSDLRTIMMSYDLKKWGLVHHFHDPRGYVLYRGWDYFYDEKEEKGFLAVNEKNNSFPAPPAIISMGSFSVTANTIQLILNPLRESGVREGLLSKVYEFPVHSARVSIRHDGLIHAFTCKKSHRSSSDSKPQKGKIWEEYWEETTATGDEKSWEEDQVYLSILDRKRIRHLHTVHKDPFSDLIIIGTGDFDDESFLFYSTDYLKEDKETGLVRLKVIGSGSQKWRTVAVEFTPDYIYWAMDSQYDVQSIFRLRKTELLQQNNRVIEEDAVELVATIPDKSFLASYCYQDGNSYRIIFSSGYEVSKYNVDNRARVFCVQEFQEGSYKFFEIASFPAKANSFGKLYPIGVDKKGYLYFNTVNLNTMPVSQILKVKVS